MAAITRIVRVRSFDVYSLPRSAFFEALMSCGTRMTLKTPPASSMKMIVGIVFDFSKMSATYVVEPIAMASIAVRTNPRTREMRVPDAMRATALPRRADAPSRVSLARSGVVCAVEVVVLSELMRLDYLSSHFGDSAFVEEGESAREFDERNPGDVDGFVIGVVFDGEFAAGRD